MPHEQLKKNLNEDNFPCPCDSQKAYKQCCEPFHSGRKAAPTPKKLMRSRYSAYALQLTDYLRATWHPATCPKDLDSADGPRWQKLKVLRDEQQGDNGTVHFKAYYDEGPGTQTGVLEEVSSFVRIKGHWLYVGGEVS